MKTKSHVTTIVVVFVIFFLSIVLQPTTQRQGSAQAALIGVTATSYDEDLSNTEIESQ